MRTILLTLCLAISASLAAVTRPLVFNGDTLPLNNDFKRKQCGTLVTSATLPEISGIACSRVTPGYIWMESDDYRNVVAVKEKGDTRYMKLSFTNLPSRWDWEDMSGGVYNGTNYLFIGAFGDNNETTGNYYIIYFPEPEIVESSSTTSIEASYISYVYPDGNKHNAEALMYDNVEQMLYVITKVYYNVCQVFSLPMSLDYGTEQQTLNYVCDLGVKEDLGDGANPFKGFHLVTAADISPDGKYILIKNHNNISDIFSWILLWTREGEESVSETLKRQPEQIACYQSEWQGEAMAWLDNDNFYTTSDEDEGNPPIYKYIRKQDAAVENIGGNSKSDKTLVMHDNQVFMRVNGELYSLLGQRVSVSK